MSEFAGKKFRPTTEYYVYENEDWWDNSKIKKTKFGLTFPYMKLLKEKRIKDLENELMIAKDKLNYQMNKYGDVDPIDYGEFLGLLAKYNKIKV